jgi:purine-binding chemotaxis protein CheW
MTVSLQASGNGTNEYLTFRLGGEEYGIDILRVQEIRGYDAVTPIMNTPAFIKGVVNLRGTIVPIVDLRLKFAVGEATYDQFTVVIILNIANRIVGIVVDSVSEVLELDPEQIRATPDLGTTVDTTYIRGLTSKDQQMLIVLDIEKLMMSRDMGLIDEQRVAA